MNNKRIDDNIIFYAFRYCLGRKTYAVAEMVDYLLDNWNDISKNLRDKIKKEIANAIENKRVGMDCDIKDWQRLLN